MKNRSLWCVACLALWLTGPGCAPVLIATGAVAGYAVSRDVVNLDLDRSREQVWNACLEEAKHLGHVKREDAKRGRLDIDIEGAAVVVVLHPLTPTTVRVVIRARRTLLPKPEIAQRLGFGIARRAERSGRLI